MLVDVRDESTAEVRVVLELKPGADPALVMAYLYKHTPLAALLPRQHDVPGAHAEPRGGGAHAPQPARHPERVPRLPRRGRHPAFRVRAGGAQGAASTSWRASPSSSMSLDETIRIIRKSDGKADAAGQAGQALRPRRRADRRHSRDEAVQAGAAGDPDHPRRAGRQAGARQGNRGHPQGRAQAAQGDSRRAQRNRREIRRQAAHQDRRWRARTTSSSRPRTSSSTRKSPSSCRATAGSSACARSRTCPPPACARATSCWLPCAARPRTSLAIFSNLGSCYVIRINDVPASTGYGEPVQKLFNFRDGERVVAALVTSGNGPSAVPAGTLAIARHPQGLRLPLQPRPAPRAVDARRAPLRQAGRGRRGGRRAAGRAQGRAVRGDRRRARPGLSRRTKPRSWPTRAAASP